MDGTEKSSTAGPSQRVHAQSSKEKWVMLISYNIMVNAREP